MAIAAALQICAEKLIACLPPPNVRLEKPAILQHEDILCMPLTSLDSRKLKLQGGLYHRQGGYIPSSGLITNKQVVVGYGPLPLPSSAPVLSGKSLYMGLCHSHFGHFLIETLSRLWFLQAQQIQDFDHIILLPINGCVPEFVVDLFKLLGVDERLKIIDAPIFLENVCIPSPAIEYPWKVHQVINTLQQLFADSIAVEPTEQPIFLSRNQLVPGHFRMIIGEDRLEQALESQGVYIYHPENYSIHHQISTLSRHKTIISFAGSALHTMLLSGGNKNVVAYSARRIPLVFPLLDKALNNKSDYVQSRRLSVNGLASLAVGFKPQLIDPRIVLRRLKQRQLIASEVVSGYGTAAADLRECNRYNTAMLLQWVREASQVEEKMLCLEKIQQFASKYPLDEEMLAQARLGSALLRGYFP